MKNAQLRRGMVTRKIELSRRNQQSNQTAPDLT